MINNDGLDFDDESHTYSRNDVEYKSVTTFIKQFFSDFDAEAVAQSKAYSYGKYADKSKQEVLDMWQQKADDGTAVHEQIERYIQGQKPQDVYDKARQGINYWDKVNDEMFIFDVQPELQVFHDEYKLAGTIDVAYKHNNKATGAKRQISLIDWKTNKAIYKTPYNEGDTGTHELTDGVPDCNWNHYSLQLSLYAHILEDQFDENIYKLELVHLKQDEYEVHKVPYRKELVSRLCQTRQQQS